jgi:hypothetical protein
MAGFIVAIDAPVIPAKAGIHRSAPGWTSNLFAGATLCSKVCALNDRSR